MNDAPTIKHSVGGKKRCPLRIGKKTVVKVAKSGGTTVAAAAVSEMGESNDAREGGRNIDF